MVSEEILRQEISDLYRFVEHLVRMCSDLRADYPIYSESSRDFFRYFEKLGNESLQFLRSFPDQILKEQDPRLAATRRQKLLLPLRSGWETLHEHLRPALNADTLHLPTPLIAALHDRLHETEEWGPFKFTLFHTDEANYFQIPSGLLGDVANQIAAEVNGTQFLPDLGHIEIPYSQADSLFLNATLAHEMGHFIYQMDASHDVEDEIDDALERMEAEIGTLEEEEVTLCKNLVSNWIQETFCDLFAICLIGPAFSFAFSQLQAASLLIGRQEGEPDEFYRFEWEHPADVARFHNHQKLLEKIGWWVKIENWSSSPVQVLRACSEPATLFTIEIDELLPEAVTQKRLLQCYDELCSWLIDYVPSRVKGHDRDVATFERQSKIISEYLKRAVVPSTIVDEGEIAYPRPVVLINAGYRFLLEDFSQLIQSIEGEAPNSIESRSKLADRLELWLLKALEDYRLLQGGGANHVSAL